MTDCHRAHGPRRRNLPDRRSCARTRSPPPSSRRACRASTAPTPAPDLRRNLDYFLECIDIAQGYGGQQRPAAVPRVSDHRLLRVDARPALPHRDRGAGARDRGSGEEGEAVQLLHRVRHLRQGREGLAGPHPAPDGHGEARRQRREALEAAQRARHVPGLRAVHLGDLRRLRSLRRDVWPRCRDSRSSAPTSATSPCQPCSSSRSSSAAWP